MQFYQLRWELLLVAHECTDTFWVLSILNQRYAMLYALLVSTNAVTLDSLQSIVTCTAVATMSTARQ
jgi:hypothetical protein